MIWLTFRTLWDDWALHYWTNRSWSIVSNKRTQCRIFLRKTTLPRCVVKIRNMNLRLWSSTCIFQSCLPLLAASLNIRYLKQTTRWFKVTFSSPNWRSLNPLRGSLYHPKKVHFESPGIDFDHFFTTLPETNSSPLKSIPTIHFWGQFVSFKEGKSLRIPQKSTSIHPSFPKIAWRSCKKLIGPEPSVQRKCGKAHSATWRPGWDWDWIWLISIYLYFIGVCNMLYIGMF